MSDLRTDPLILAPNRYASTLRMWFVSCPCGASLGQRDGLLSNHFPSFGSDGTCRLTDPFCSGNALCRHSGRAVTLQAAVARDEVLTASERYVRNWTRAALSEGTPR